MNKLNYVFGIFILTIHGCLKTAPVETTINQMNAGEVSAGEMNAGEVSAGEMNAGDMSAGEMNAGDMSAGEMNAGEMEAGEMNAGEMEAGEMNAGEMEAGEMNAGEMNAGEMNAGEMNAGEMSAGEISAGEVSECLGLVYIDLDGTELTLGDTCAGRGQCGEGVVECADGPTLRCDTWPEGSQNQSTIEICNQLDDDCDGKLDEGFDLLRDNTNCGSCDTVCDHANAESICLAGNCRIRSCDDGYLDIDQDEDNGCLAERAIVRVGTSVESNEAIFNDISSALEAVEEGGTIIVEPGLYFENITIDKPVIIRASEVGMSTLVSAPGVPSITIESDDVTVQGFVLQATDTCTGIEVASSCGRPDSEPCTERVRILDLEILSVCSIDDVLENGIGINIQRGTDILLLNNTIDDVHAGPIDRSEAFCSPNRPANYSAGIKVSQSQRVYVESNVVSWIRGGLGDQAWYCGGRTLRGGNGGIAQGILVEAVQDSLFIDNQITHIYGGAGGDTSAQRWATGPGGLAAGIALKAGSTDNHLIANLVSDLEGGEPGNCYNDQETCTATRGAPGFTLGIQLDPTNSLENIIESSNFVEADPVIYLYGANGGVIDGYQLDGTTPTTNFGKIAVIQSQGVTVSNNIISNLVGAPGGSSLSVATGGQRGGNAHGIYVMGGQLNQIVNNDISALTGGVGGTASISSDGGTGGSAIGVFVSDSERAEVRDNRIYSLRGGIGGSGCASGNGGVGGGVEGIYFGHADWSSTNQNMLFDFEGADGGPGGRGWGEGIDGQKGLVRGIKVEDSIRMTLNNDLIHNLEARLTSGIHLYGSTSAEINHTSLYFIRGESNADGIFVDQNAQATITNSIISRAEHTGVKSDEQNAEAAVSIGHSVIWKNGQLDDNNDDLSNVSADSDSIIFEDPNFVNPANGDMSLAIDSPCIDAGTGDCPAEPSLDNLVPICDIGHLGNTLDGQFRE